MLRRGDTIIEVMLAITIFSMIAVGTLVLMNRSIGSIQTSLEVTLVRQQIDTQVELLRMVHSQAREAGLVEAATNWAAITNTAVASVAPLSSLVSGGDCVAAPTGTTKFIINPETGRFNASAVFTKAGDATSPAPYAMVRVSAIGQVVAEGVWAQVIRGGSSDPTQPNYPQYYDFHVRACWAGAEGSVPVTLGTITRIYDAL